MVDIHWDNLELHRFLQDPHGDVGQALHDVADKVADRAKVLAKKRTGAMAAETHAEQREAADGMYFDIGSSANNPKSRGGFPYPIMHERLATTDHVKQPSLRPALEALPAILAEE